MPRLLMVVVGVLAASGALAGEAPAAPNQWVKAGEDGKAGKRLGAALAWDSDLKRAILLGGRLEAGAAYVQAFDPAAGAWSDLSAENIAKLWGESPPSCQAAYDPNSKRVFCLHGGSLHSFDPGAKAWKALGGDVAGAYPALTCDAAGRQLVAVGADLGAKNLGWSVTSVYDIAGGKWTLLVTGSEAERKAHEDRKVALDAIRELVGRTRLAWYRDPAGAGSDAERKDLADRAAALGKLPGMETFKADLETCAGKLGDKKGLDALKAARALQRKFEEAMEAAAPTPPSRRNARIAYDAANKVVVLFGGDHEDYLMNDTWVLDIEKKAWKRGTPKMAPSPRGGGVLVYLPKSGKVALYDGYVQSTSTDYGAGAHWMLPQHDLWVYDVKADSWALAAGGTGPQAPGGAGFYGYSNQNYAFPAITADGDDNLIALAGASAVKLAVDASKADAAAAEKAGKPANTRLYRPGPFVAEFCEVPDAPKDPALDKLPANQWVRLPAAPRNPAANGVRCKTWSSATWDSDNEQILYWGGGHCIRSASTPLHWSPASGRLVDAYDADEPYGRNGGGAYGQSLLGRAWVSVHSYRIYAYDPKAKLMVTGYGGLYDPVKMDWVHHASHKQPFEADWGGMIFQTTPHGVVAWAHLPSRGPFGLWLFDLEKGWSSLQPVGPVPGCWCDSNGLTYDSKRDRLVLGPAGGKSGQMTTFDFATKKVDKLAPTNEELGRINNSREMTYVAHADWVLFLEPLSAGGKSLTRVYDCEKNCFLALDAGNPPAAEDQSLHSLALMYDAKRKLVYAINHTGLVRALKLDPATAKVQEKP